MAARRLRMLTCALAVSLAFAGRAAADEILFLNGDRLTGKIVSADGGKLTIKSETAGVVTVDLAKVKTFSTDEPIVIKTGDTTLSSKVTGGADGTVQVVPVAGGTPQVIALKDVAKINPPPVKWTGSFVANALVTTGNSETENFGVSLNAVRRSEIDRITLGGAYYDGRQKEKDTDKHGTTIDNWFIFITDWFGDYNLNVDAGVRATIYEGLFAEAKVELRYDSTPAPGAKKEDVRYLLGVGWSF